MKKLFTLAAAVLATASLWAQTDADVAVDAMTDADAATYFKEYDDVTLLKAGEYQKTGEYYNIKADQTNNTAYVGVTSTKGLSKVAFLVTGNGKNKNINAGLIGYNEVPDEQDFSKADYASYVNPSVAIASGNYSDAKWVEFDLSDYELKAVYFAKQWKNVVVGTAAKANFPSESAQSLFVYGIRVWVAGEVVTYTVTYDSNNESAQSVKAEEQKKVAENMFDVPEGYMFAGWNTEADGTGTAYAPGEKLESDLTLYAQWEAITTCTTLIPASAGEDPAVGDEVVLDVDAEGGKIFVAGMKAAGDIKYTASGLQIGGGSADSVRVELFNYLKEGSIITLKMAAGGTSERGLNLQTVAKKTAFAAKWTPAENGEVKTFSYTVTATDGLAGANKFLLQRNNTVYLQEITVANCGEAVPGIVVDETPVLRASITTVDLNITAAEPTVSAKVTFSGKYLTPGEYTLTVPEVEGLTVTPASVTVAEDGKLNAEVTIAYASEVEVAAATAELGLTIGELSSKVTLNYSATIEKTYITSSLNIEQLVLDNGTNYDIKAALTAAGWEYENLSTLDSLNDDKPARNEPYLGLKLKTSGAYLAGWLKATDALLVKFGNLGKDDAEGINVYINGTENKLTHEALVNAERVLFLAYETDTYIKIVAPNANTYVFKQLMLNEDIAEVTLPASPETTAIDNTDAAVKATKRVINGVLFIEKNGVLYNAQGAVVK